MSTPIDQLDVRAIPPHLRDRFLAWRGKRSAAARHFGDPATIKGKHPAAAAVANHTKAAVAAWVDAAGAWWRVQADVTRTPEGRLVAGARQLRGKLKAPHAALQAAYVEAIEAGDEVAKRLERRMQAADPVQAILDGEMRAYLRSLPHAERGSLVREDVRFAAAVARAPAALSGASEALHSQARTAYLRQVAAEDFEAHEDLERAVKAARESLLAIEGLPAVELGCDFARAEQLQRASEAADAA